MDDNTQYLKELADAEKRRKQTEIEQAKAEALRSYQTQEAEARPQFQQQRQTASTQSQINAKNLAEFWARRGQTNQGITAQAELSRQNTLAGNLGDITTNENTFIKQLQDQTNTTTRNLDYQLQDAYSGIDNDLNTNLYNEKLRQQQAEAQRQQALAEEQRYQQEMAYKQQQDKIKQQQWATEFSYKQQQDALDRQSSGGGSYTLPNGQTIEQDFKVQNGTPYQLVNGKWVAITYPKDKETGQTLPEYAKLEKWNKAGFQLTNSKSDFTWNQGKDKFNIWINSNDGQPYVIMDDQPIPLNANFGETVLDSVNKGTLSNSRFETIAKELGLTKQQFIGQTQAAQFGNNQDTAQKKDYLFNTNQNQPRYINNIKISSAGIIKNMGDKIQDTAERLGLGYNSTQNIWKAGKEYFIWLPNEKLYKNVTSWMK